MKSNIHVSKTVDETIHQLADKIYQASLNTETTYFHMAISGGSTPLKLFKYMGEAYASRMPWHKFKLFWVDERCVPPDHKESNYGNASQNLLSHVNIPENQVYRIKGENKPEDESKRYDNVLGENLPFLEGYPRLDFIILGMGSDGHTASIFPDQMHLLESEKFCDVAEHPETGQKRITLTGRVINNAAYIAFLVTGENKAHTSSQVMNENNRNLPATLIQPGHGVVEWYLDGQAASKL
jgi:6-phosphogluconolactonase